MSSAHAKDIHSALHPYSNLDLHLRSGAHIITGGEGIYVKDAEGNRFIDGMAGLFCASLGYSESSLIEAATRQMKALPFYHSFAHTANIPSIELSEKLVSISPVPMSKVFFASSGSEANDTAIKMIWYYQNAMGKPKKKKIISRERAYHGVTVASASLTGLPYLHTEFDLPIQSILHTDCPGFYRYGKPGETEEEFVGRCVANLEELILREGPDTIAAFFAEPVQVSGGVILPPAGYFEKVQAILNKYDILFVADEVITGFGRTGNMFGTQTYGLKPDIITLAKQLSAAYMPISAIMVNERVFEGLRVQSQRLGTFAHGFTYGGHPVAAAVALEAQKIYEERDIVGHVRKVAERFADGLKRLGEHRLIGEVRQVGLVAGLEFVRNKESRENFTLEEGVAATLRENARRNGVLTRANNNALVVCPPLIITESELDELLERIGKTLDDTLSDAVKAGVKLD